MISLLSILNEVQEGVKVSSDYDVKIDVVKQSDNPQEDDFVINRSKAYKKVGNIPVYYGFSQNTNKDRNEAELTKIFNNVKKNNNLINDEELYKLVLLTAPQEKRPDKIITLYSSSDLNSRLASALAKKYNVPSQDGQSFVTTKKKLYKPKEMVNREAYEDSDPTTRKMVDTFVRCLEKKFGEDAQINIKKSGYDGVCGLQSGARRLLNPTYDMEGMGLNKNSKILIVDDFLVSGSSIREIFSILVNELGIPKQNISGYTLALK